jgi:hypothetical protein
MTAAKNTKAAAKAAFDRTDGPGLARLRKAKNAEVIRNEIIADQAAGSAKAKARIAAAAKEAAPAAVQTSKDGHSAPAAPSAAPTPEGPHTARAAAPAKPSKIIEPTPIPVPAERMEGMSIKTAAKFIAAATGELPEPPDLSAPSTSPSDRKELALLVEMAKAGDCEGLRAYGIRPYYTGAIKLDRYRQCAVIAIEARRAEKGAA